jgi:hypothetical protein
MADFPITCPSCQQEATERIGQAIAQQRILMWWKAIACPHCNYTLEIDDSGFPPFADRAAILAHDGAWSLLLNDEKIRTGAAKTLRGLFVLTLQEALAMANHPAHVVWTGTECEVIWLASHLEANGVKTTRVRGAVAENSMPPTLRAN